MNYKVTDGIKISEVILGTDYYGGRVDKETAFKLYNKYIELGGNCIDTAKIYENGKSEEICGLWIKKSGIKRENIVISTKGAHPIGTSTNKSRLSEREIEEDLDSSLKRLGGDYIDIYWLHRDDINVPAEEIITSLNKFIKKGKIRTIGASNWKYDRIKKANDFAYKNGLKPFSASQIKWSAAVTSPDYTDDPTLVEMNESEYEKYKNDNISVFAFASQGKGFFAKMLSGGIESLDTKTRERYLCEENLKRLEKFKEIYVETNVSVASQVLAYICEDKNINSYAIIGPKNEEQLIQTLI